MKKINYYFIFFLLFILSNCSLSKKNLSFTIKHGGKWIVQENGYDISISLDPSNSSFKGELNCSKIEGNYFIDNKKANFFNILSIEKACKDTSRKKIEENFIDLLQKVDSHKYNDERILLYRGNLVLIKLKREP